MVGRPSRRSGNGRETLLEGWNWSEYPLRGPEVVGRRIRRSASGRETFPEVRKWLGDLPGGPEVVRNPLGGPGLVRRPYRRSGNGW